MKRVRILAAKAAYALCGSGCLCVFYNIVLSYTYIHTFICASAGRLILKQVRLGSVLGVAFLLSDLRFSSG